MCTHFCERLLQDDVFQYESSLCLVCGLAILALHFDACMQVIRRSFSGRPTLLRLFYVSETRGGECSESELSPPNRCKESNEDEEGVELLADVSLFQRPILRSYTLTNLRRSVGCCTDHICGRHVLAPRHSRRLISEIQAWPLAHGGRGQTRRRRDFPL